MTHAEKLAAAIAYLGKRYVCHPANFVPKGDYEMKHTKTDLAETFARVKRRKDVA